MRPYTLEQFHRDFLAGRLTDHDQRLQDVTAAATAVLAALSEDDRDTAVAVAREAGIEDVLVALGVYFTSLLLEVEHASGVRPGDYLRRLGLSAHGAPLP